MPSHIEAKQFVPLMTKTNVIVLSILLNSFHFLFIPFFSFFHTVFVTCKYLHDINVHRLQSVIIVCIKCSQGTKRKLEYGVKDKNEEDDEIPKKSKQSRKYENKSSKSKNECDISVMRQCDVSHGSKKRKLKKIKESDGNEESDGKENENNGSDASNSSNDGSIQDDYEAPRHSSRLKIQKCYKGMPELRIQRVCSHAKNCLLILRLRKTIDSY